MNRKRERKRMKKDRKLITTSHMHMFMCILVVVCIGCSMFRSDYLCHLFIHLYSMRCSLARYTHIIIHRAVSAAQVWRERERREGSFYYRSLILLINDKGKFQKLSLGHALLLV